MTRQKMDSLHCQPDKRTFEVKAPSLLPLFFMLVLLFCSFATHAASVVIVKSAETALYEEVFKAFEAELAAFALDKTDDIKIAVTTDLKLQPKSLKKYDLIIALGQRASQFLNASRINQPQLHLLVSQYQFRSPEQCCSQVFAIYLEQPLGRQLAFIRTLLPDRRRIGILQGPQSKLHKEELASLAKGMGMELKFATIARKQDIGPTLDQWRNKIDVLLALPDRTVYNRQTLSSILLSTYRNRIPVIGFSKGLVTAGALAALHSTPSLVGKEAAIKARRLLQSLPVKNGHPERYTFSVNRKVARSLHLQLPTNMTLQTEWGNGE